MNGVFKKINKKICLAIFLAVLALSVVTPNLTWAQTSTTEKATLELSIENAKKKIEYIKGQQAKIDQLIQYYLDNSLFGNIDSTDPVYNKLIKESGASEDGTGTSVKIISPLEWFHNTAKENKINGWKQDKANLGLEIGKWEEKIGVWELQLSGAPAEDVAAAEQKAKDNYKAAGQKRISEMREFGFQLQKQYDKKLAGCSLTNFSLSVCFYEAGASLTGFTVWLTSWILRLANNFFNLSIWISIKQFYVYASLAPVNAAWGIVRDICNLFFIFILLYIAISTILKDFTGGDTKKLLSSVIVVALLVNFSAVVPKVVIDVSNILALQFYEAMGAGASRTTMDAPDLTSKLLAGFDFGEYSDPTQASTIGSNLDSYGAIILANLGQIILMLITTFVLLAGGLMFLFRTMALLFLIISSPVFFLGYAVPAIGKHSGAWLSALISQSLFAPVMMFMMLVTLTFAGSGETSLKSQLAASMGTSSSLITFFYFAIINGMMIGSLLIASKIATTGSGVIGSYGNKFKNWGTALVAGGAVGSLAYASRNVIGRSASRMADNKNLIDRAAKGSVIAKMQLQAARKVAGSSFDVRATKIGGSIVKPADFGKAGGKGGYQAQLSKQIKAQETFVKESGFTDEQQKTYAESLEKRGRLGIKWLGAPRKRQKAAEKIGDLAARRKVDQQNTDTERQNKQKDDQISTIKSSPVYVQAKTTLDAETQNLKAAETSLATALEQGQSKDTIDNYRRYIEATKISIKQAQNDFNELDKDIKKLENEKGTPVTYKKKEKSIGEQLDESLDKKGVGKKEEKEEEPKKEEKK